MHDYVRQALGLADGPWPPDFYTLLGLSPADATPPRVEAAVLERMERLRAYQLTHPEPVTEAMNLLARALVALTEPAARREQDAGIVQRSAGEVTFGLADEEPVAAPSEPPLADAAVDLPAENIRPARRRRRRARLSQPAVSAAPAAEAAAAEPPAEGPSLFRAVTSRGRREPIRRLVRLRRLLDAWNAAGAFVGDPELALSSRSEAVAIIAALRQITGGSDGVLDDEGPGGAVLALARTRLTITLLTEMSDARRELLADDWRAGRRLLTEIYWRARALVGRRHQAAELRRRWRRSRRRLSGLVLIGAAAVAVPVALLRLAT